MITWEAMLFIYQYGMTDGGPLGSIIGYIFCWAGYTCVALCLGELNSIYPTAGGQYRELSLLPRIARNELTSNNCAGRLDMRAGPKRRPQSSIVHDRRRYTDG